jgi:hypothetical protein
MIGRFVTLEGMKIKSVTQHQLVNWRRSSAYASQVRQPVIMTLIAERN